VTLWLLATAVGSAALNVGTGTARSFKGFDARAYAALGSKPNIHMSTCPNRSAAAINIFTESKPTGCGRPAIMAASRRWKMRRSLRQRFSHSSDRFR